MLAQEFCKATYQVIVSQTVLTWHCYNEDFKTKTVNTEELNSSKLPNELSFETQS